MSRLFQPLALGALHLENRIVIAPMCQYSATEGTPGDWHVIHLGQLALSGAGLLIIEAAAVSPEGRISPRDLGLYCAANEAGLARVLDAVRAHSPMPIAVQLAHAGRKASVRVPWEGGAQIGPGEPGGWKTVSASALPFAAGSDAPMALDAAGLARLRAAFAQAAQRAARLGLDGIEIHAAHGSNLGGAHLELTGEDVTECTGGARGLSDADLARAYRTQVDPRLNYEQALELGMMIAERSKKARAS